MIELSSDRPLLSLEQLTKRARDERRLVVVGASAGATALCVRRLLARPAAESDWDEEYLGPILAVRVVDDLDAAVEHIRAHSSDLIDVIVTRDYRNAQEFLRRIGSSTVGVNCSTAYADGYRLGLGAEIGISNSRMHWYGPMGLEGLTTRKFVLYGDGQLRE